MVMEITALIEATVARLSERTGIAAIAWDQPLEQRLLTEEGCLIVHYMGERANVPSSVGCVRQEGTVRIGVTVKSKSLRAVEGDEPAAGAYALIESVKRALIGWRPDPEDDAQMYLVSVELVDIAERTFLYGMQFEVPTTHIEETEPYESPKLETARFYREEKEKVVITHEE